nr:MAG TPA: hypothetical protein [Caudoviricetes sp.]DAO18316.1 MAG TPA: hypothetical protein [Bacteriophage sp.]DAP38746.1 MAG TPA: hypothetical protein [Caudoviricetes sp.]
MLRVLLLSCCFLIKNVILKRFFHLKKCINIPFVLQIYE